MEQLQYARDVPRPVRRLHRLVMPMLWLPAGAAAAVYYGDEYGAFVLANLPGGLLLYAVGLAGPLLRLPSEGWMSGVVITGAVLIWLGGWGMDRLRVPPRAYIALPVLTLLIGGLLLGGLVRPGRVPPSPWSRSDYFYQEFCSVAWSWVINAFAFGSLAGFTIVRLAHRQRFVSTTAAADDV